jgi:trans-aconitate 2-methyltransferase
MSSDWNAASYDKVSGPQASWAETVLERLPLRGDETVLDAGCGSGRVTAMLLERLPEGHVVAVDSAPSMVEHARAALPADRTTVLCANLTDLELDEPVDAVFSNAVFHWVPDHELLFKRMHDALKPGGVLVAQCGGKGNVAGFLGVATEVATEAPYAEHLRGFSRSHHFESPEDTEPRLRAAGFDEINCWLHTASTEPDEPLEFARTVCLREYLETLPEDLREPYAAEVVRRIGEPMVLDYVRLNIDARRSLVSGKKG